MDADDWSLLKKGALIAVGAIVGLQLLRILKLVFLDLFQTKDLRKKRVPEDLPKQVLVKTKTESFNHQYYVVVRNGRIYFKPIETAEQLAAGQWNKWSILGKDGLPRPGFFSNPNPSGWFALHFQKPKFITEVNADGDNLICIGPYDDPIIYYMKWTDFKWQGRWGLYLWLGFALGPPAWIRLPPDNLGYAISHRGSYNNYMEDINGTKHHSITGCTTLYLLDKDQLSIYYVDPWLSPYWTHHHFEGPTLSDLTEYRKTHKNADGFWALDRHRIKMVYMNASGSNIFVISTTGQLFTRLVDFDIAGMNPVFKYTYKRQHFDDDTIRALPDPGWVEHTPISPKEGRATSLLTVFQCGRGSSAYELRVAGFNAKNVKGYFYKPITPADGSWTFVPDADLPITSDNVVAYSNKIETAPLIGVDYTYSHNVNGKNVAITLKDYNPLYGETDVAISVDGKPLDYNIKLFAIGLFMKYKGTFVVPDRFVKAEPELFNTLFQGKKVLPVKIRSPQPKLDAQINDYQSPSFIIKDRLDGDNNSKFTAAVKSFVVARHFKWEFIRD